MEVWAQGQGAYGQDAWPLHRCWLGREGQAFELRDLYSE